MAKLTSGCIVDVSMLMLLLTGRGRKQTLRLNATSTQDCDRRQQRPPHFTLTVLKIWRAFTGGIDYVWLLLTAIALKLMSALSMASQATLFL
jgi:hypothetical protein